MYMYSMYTYRNTSKKSLVTILTIWTEIWPLEYGSKLNRDICLEWFYLKFSTYYKLNKYIFRIRPISGVCLSGVISGVYLHFFFSRCQVSVLQSYRHLKIASQAFLQTS